MKLYDYLKSLGDTPEQVAATLRIQGVKGVKKSRFNCPILNGIYTACPDYWSGLQIVNGRKASDGNYYYSATLDDPQIMNPCLPEAVMNFIGRFDEGLYPDLECERIEKSVARTYVSKHSNQAIGD